MCSRSAVCISQPRSRRHLHFPTPPLFKYAVWPPASFFLLNLKGKFAPPNLFRSSPSLLSLLSSLSFNPKIWQMADIEGEERNKSILTLWDQNRRRRLPLFFLSPDDALRSIFHPGRRKKRRSEGSQPFKGWNHCPIFLRPKEK